MCPACGQQAGVEIVYGAPTTELLQRADRGEIISGGCLIDPDAPDRKCMACGHLWRQQRADGPAPVI